MNSFISGFINRINEFSNLPFKLIDFIFNLDDTFIINLIIQKIFICVLLYGIFKGSFIFREITHNTFKYIGNYLIELNIEYEFYVICFIIIICGLITDNIKF
jgi:hypothetical protein